MGLERGKDGKENLKTSKKSVIINQKGWLRMEKIETNISLEQ